ncbi:MAG: hypothetical protein ACYCSN_19485 [Acidobacteriaceae bacterium]
MANVLGKGRASCRNITASTPPIDFVRRDSARLANGPKCELYHGKRGLSTDLETQFSNDARKPIVLVTIIAKRARENTILERAAIFTSIE